MILAELRHIKHDFCVAYFVSSVVTTGKSGLQKIKKFSMDWILPGQTGCEFMVSRSLGTFDAEVPGVGRVPVSGGFGRIKSAARKSLPGILRGHGTRVSGSGKRLQAKPGVRASNHRKPQLYSATQQFC